MAFFANLTIKSAAKKINMVSVAIISCMIRAANSCPALGDDRHILVIFLILRGGGMILRFLIF